mmetsp:Transcript_149284/g.212218  ORF Transcript_149284/g.212218 Transcript_149284/m.212218 type:complete len:239 (-) Transcript_149284:278-994(-)
MATRRSAHPKTRESLGAWVGTRGTSSLTVTSTSSTSPRHAAVITTSTTKARSPLCGSTDAGGFRTRSAASKARTGVPTSRRACSVQARLPSQGLLRKLRGISSCRPRLHGTSRCTPRSGARWCRLRRSIRDTWTGRLARIRRGCATRGRRERPRSWIAKSGRRGVEKREWSSSPRRRRRCSAPWDNCVPSRTLTCSRAASRSSLGVPAKVAIFQEVDCLLPSSPTAALSALRGSRSSG